MKQKENEMDYRLLSSIIHELISVAESTSHNNPCPHKDSCAIMIDVKKRLYTIREEILEVIQREEEENGH